MKKQIKFSDFKIIPILSSAKRLKISDEEYFSNKYSDYISNSRLGYINPEQGGSPSKYKVPPHFSTQSLILGSAIHELILQSEEFSLAPKCNKPTAKLGATIDKIKSYRDAGESIYDSIIKASKDCNYYVSQIDSKIPKIIKEGLKYYLSLSNQENIITLNDKDWDICNSCVTNVLNNQDIQKALHPIDNFGLELPSFNEDALFLDVIVTYKKKYTILKLKMKADNWTIDEDRKILTLNDLKTTSKNINWFMNQEYGSFYHYHYYRQFALYLMMLESFCINEYGFNKKWEVESNVLVVNTADYNTKLFKVNKEQLSKGKQEYEELLKRVAYYEMNNYNCEVEFI